MSSRFLPPIIDPSRRVAFSSSLKEQQEERFPTMVTSSVPTIHDDKENIITEKGDISKILTGGVVLPPLQESLSYWQSAYLAISRQFQSVVSVLDQQNRALGVERDLRKALTAIANSNFNHEEPRIVLNTVLLRAIDVICERAGGQAFCFITPDGMPRFLPNATERQQYIFSTSTAEHAQLMRLRNHDVPNFDHTPMFQAAVSGGREILYSGAQIRNTLIANENEKKQAEQQGRKPVTYCALPPGHFGIQQLWLSPFTGCLLGCSNGEYPSALREAVNNAMPAFLDSVVRVVSEATKSYEEREQRQLETQLSMLHRKIVRVAQDYDDIPEEAMSHVLNVISRQLNNVYVTFISVEEKEQELLTRKCDGSIPSSTGNPILQMSQYRLGNRINLLTDNFTSGELDSLFDTEFSDQLLIWSIDRKPTYLDSTTDLPTKLADCVLRNPIAILPVFYAGKPAGALIVYGPFMDSFASTVQDALSQSITLLQRKSESLRHDYQLQGQWQVPDAIKNEVAKALQQRKVEIANDSLDKSTLERSVLLSWKATPKQPIGLLMADLVGSTVWESWAGPVRMANIYTSLWARLGKSMKHFPGVIPFKVIGDCYVALSGIPIPTDSLTELVHFGLSVHDEMATEWESSKLIEIAESHENFDRSRRSSCSSQSRNPNGMYMRVGCGATNSDDKMYCYVGVPDECPILDVTGTQFSEVERMMKGAPGGRGVIVNDFLANLIKEDSNLRLGSPIIKSLQGHGEVSTRLVSKNKDTQ